MNGSFIWALLTIMIKAIDMPGTKTTPKGYDLDRVDPLGRTGQERLGDEENEERDTEDDGRDNVDLGKSGFVNRN